jgi:hypothetical protein
MAKRRTTPSTKQARSVSDQVAKQFADIARKLGLTEDDRQDAIVALLEKESRGETVRNPLGYGITIARRRRQKELRRIRRASPHSEDHPTGTTKSMESLNLAENARNEIIDSIRVNRRPRGLLVEVIRRATQLINASMGRALVRSELKWLRDYSREATSRGGDEATARRIVRSEIRLLGLMLPKLSAVHELLKSSPGPHSTPPNLTALWFTRFHTAHLLEAASALYENLLGQVTGKLNSKPSKQRKRSKPVSLREQAIRIGKESGVPANSEVDEMDAVLLEFDRLPCEHGPDCMVCPSDFFGIGRRATRKELAALYVLMARRLPTGLPSKISDPDDVIRHIADGALNQRRHRLWKDSKARSTRQQG